MGRVKRPLEGTSLFNFQEGEIFISKVTVIDAPCGAGKTSWAIQEINSHPEGSYIYCTPFLDEITRIREACGKSRLKEPQNFASSKIEDFNSLLEEGAEVATTHSTFLNATAETLELLGQGQYTLILDETLDILTEFNKVASVEQRPEQVMGKDDVRFALEKELIAVDDAGRVHWTGGEYDGKFSELERLAKTGRVFLAKDTLLVCLFPVEVFDLFENVFVMTYLFEGTALCPYFKAFNIEFETVSVKKEGETYTLCEHNDEAEATFREQVKSLVTLYRPDREKPQFKNTALSKGWCYREREKKVREVRGKIKYFVREVVKAKPAEIMWTCIQDYERDFRGHGYTSIRRITKAEKARLSPDELKRAEQLVTCFVPCNAKATNIYGNRSVLVYACNMYPNSMLDTFWSRCSGGQGIFLDRDLFALACLIQWVFRSRIRNGQPVHLYILSARMADLWERWLDGEMTD